MKLSRQAVGYAMAVAGAILFSSKAVVVKMAYAYPVDAETLLALRMGCSLPFYLIIGWITLRSRNNPPTARQILSSMAVGIVGYWLASYTDFLGLLYISATFERLILFTYPLFVVILGWAFFGGRLHRGLIPALAISYSGLALVFWQHPAEGGSNVVLGAGMVLACALSFALYQLLAKQQIAHMGSQLFTPVAMIGATIGTFISFFVHHHWDDLVVVTTILPHAAFLAIGATVIPSFFLNGALGRISAQANGAIGMISPIATIIMSSLLLNESMSWSEMVGAALVVAGVAFFVWVERRT